LPSLTIWTRLEPRCRSADLGAALEARTHDPYWMLARQWQLGEFNGDDSGSPIIASISSIDVPLNRYTGLTGGPMRIPAETPLEAWVEQEAVHPTRTSIDYRLSADSGLYFLRLLRANDVTSKYATAYISEYGIAAPTDAQRTTLDAPALALADVVARRVPDGIRLAADLRAAQPALPAMPAIPNEDQQSVRQVANAFVGWLSAVYDQPASNAPPLWDNARMEYHFSIDASATDTPCAFVAGRYTGEPLDWPSFDRVSSALGPVTAPPAAVTRTVVPAPVTFKGMPARRYWQFEDANVDIGAIDAGPADLARLMLREFALIYGNDWFVIPLPVAVGSVVSITSLVVTDTFGVTQSIPHYAATPDGGSWHIFALSGDALDHRLLLPPVLARGLASDPQEQVLLVRDDAASMAWAIERVVAGASGAPIDQASASAAAATSVPPPSGTLLHYQLGTSVPEYYIPFVAAPLDPTQPPSRRMQRAAFLRTDGTRTPITPRGRILTPDVPLFEEEFIREGIRLERMYRLARWTDGSTHLWLARRKVVGAVAGSSRLQFDRIVTATG
jgi:hypothetical protein